MPDPKNGSRIVAPDGTALGTRERLIARRFALECDCGSENLVRFGPFVDATAGDGETVDPGLRWSFTCQQCGEGVRIYATSPAWRARRVLMATATSVPVDTGVTFVAAYDLDYPTAFQQGRTTFQRGETLPDDATPAQRHGFNNEESRTREVNEAEARGYERGRAATIPAPPE